MNDLKERVRKAVTVAGITKVELAREAGLHANTLAGVERPEWDPRVSTLDNLLKAVDRIQERRAV